MTLFKERLEEYTEAEFLAFLEEMTANPKNLRGRDFGKKVEKYVEHFEKITEHPDGSDVIFYPKNGRDDSSAAILQEIKEWRSANGKPGFKPESN
jgi:hypothetical protein